MVDGIDLVDNILADETAESLDEEAYELYKFKVRPSTPTLPVTLGCCNR